MLTALLMMSITVGGFTYDVVTVSDKAKTLARASGTPETWKEQVVAIEAKAPKDAAFTRYMRAQAVQLQRDYYGEDSTDGQASFETQQTGGSMEVSERVTAASPDLVAVSIETSSYESGAAHPNLENAANINWSRRLLRPLRQSDVFAVAPDLALRRLALARFDNPDVATSDMAGELPLDWDTARIGPEGITWSFGPYELGGYLSGGETTVGWADLKPYLHRQLPFAIGAIRAATPDQNRPSIDRR